MSFSDLFDSEFKKRNADHFAAIVRVAMADGFISHEEKEFLNRLAQKLEIDENEYQAILKDYQSHPINPPASYDLRLERLYDLARMIRVDKVSGEAEMLLLKKIAVGLGFHAINIKYIIDKALTLVDSGSDLDNFVYQMRHMNQ